VICLSLEIPLTRYACNLAETLQLQQKIKVAGTNHFGFSQVLAWLKWR
jgi:UDP-glucose 4-epimerase